MTRFALLLLALMLASPLAAQDKQTLCAVSADIVDAAVTARAGGAGDGAAIRQIADGLNGDKAAFKPAVEPIVNWVYTLPEDQLDGKVAEVYKETCLNN